MSRHHAALAAAAVALLAVGCAGAPSSGVGKRGGTPPRSNIVRADYAGSEACAPCHPAIHQAWLRSPMHNMTRVPTDPGVEIRAPFDGRTFQFRDDAATFERHGAERFLRVRSPAFGDHLYRVTKVIGGRRREDFAGLEVTGTGRDARVVGDPDAELVLPVSYVFDTGTFRVKGYSVMVEERPGLKAGGVWNQTCVLCHNTYPLIGSLFGALHGPGAPGYQGEVVDRILPASRRWSWKVTDRDGLAAAVADEVAFLGGAPPPPPAGDADEARRALMAHAARTLRDRFVPAKLVEHGVGCESCHGGSREHVGRNTVLPSFEPRSPFLEPRPPAGGTGAVTRAEWINRACARCHQVLFSRYPYTWEAGRRRDDEPGGSHINSGEARDFLLGACARQMSCVTCHDPHGGDRPEHLAALATPAGNKVCTGCHPSYATPAALKDHAHHDPARAGGACIACHMPRKNMGLGHELTRYHRIGSPTDRARVEGDRPLECALCHPAARVDELVLAMERWWGKRYDRRKLLELYGDFAAPVLAVTAARGKPHEQATALAALGDSRDPTAVPALAAGLAHPYPLVRGFARHALSKIRPVPKEIDIDQDGAQIRTAVARWLAK